jgi:uncharacterized protein
VIFDACFGGQSDQAGLLLRADAETWLKAGVEVSDGALQVSAVLTLGGSDWPVAPVPEWAGRQVTVRASRAGDAVTVRARVDDEPFRLVRVAPSPPASRPGRAPTAAPPPGPAWSSADAGGPPARW